ncbi:MFS transporter [Nocardioides sp. zg-536]|uniref:MFS transporter n=1 Tax=Nocardioides faecalis TaxID=2803858 RepID=A0A938Y6B8_9ACTN|nr:MFS transporter [Nocardioides faecalis]MBM9460019.1 MFS transporter [Nocardioides faecalis]MBS4753113.1 MFS transporter [Nocardioides faecalis]QVI58760.1 MFS transporter [Nocardioides faecalis]
MSAPASHVTPPTGLEQPDPRRWWALAVLGLTNLVVVLDSTIVAIALPAAQADLGMADSQRQWVITAYALAFGALLLLGGRIADYWGRKRTFMVGMVGFGAASVWGGLAQSGGELIAARAVQGAFAAMLAPAALAMLTVLFARGKERDIAFAVFGIIAGTGAAFGLLLGGILTQYADWRWCLLVNIFFVAIGLLGGWKLLVEARAEGRNRYDIFGTVTVTLALASLVYGFARAEHGWGETDTIGFLAAGVVLLAVFVLSQTRIGNPLLPLRVVLHPVRAAAFSIQAVVGAVMMGAMLYLTFHFQIVLGMSPVMAGVANIAMTAVIMATAPVSTKMLAGLGPRVVLVLGPVLGASGMFYLSRITPDGSYWSQILPGLVLLGLGLSLIFVPMQNLALAGVDPHDAGVASALASASLNIGGSIGIAIFTALYAGRLEDSLAEGADMMTAFTDGYSITFVAAGVILLIGAVICGVLIRGSREDLAPASDMVVMH